MSMAGESLDVVLGQGRVIVGAEGQVEVHTDASFELLQHSGLVDYLK